MNEALKSLDIRHLENKFAELEIEIGSNEAGSFIACSNSEPLFCVERDSLEAIREAVTDTLKSYIRVFYKGLDEAQFNIVTTSKPISPPVIPHQFFKPIASLRSQVEDSRGKRYAIA